MTNPINRAFFLGRATAEVLYEELEHQLTNTLSTVGKFDAEQRQKLRQFTNQVMEKADLEAARSPQSYASAPGADPVSTDLQETIDELRAEIAQLRSALQNYRSHSS